MVSVVSRPMPPSMAYPSFLIPRGGPLARRSETTGTVISSRVPGESETTIHPLARWRGKNLEEMLTDHCSHCGNGLDELGHCTTCRAARSRRWYRENSSLESAKRGLTAKLKRRLGPDQLEGMKLRLSREQEGVCACCRQADLDLSIDWSLDETTDDGIPCARAAICRSCKIAVNRVVHPSRFVLEPAQLAQVETYLRMPWRDIRKRGAGLSQPLDVASWLKSL